MLILAYFLILVLALFIAAVVFVALAPIAVLVFLFALRSIDENAR